MFSTNRFQFFKIVRPGWPQAPRWVNFEALNTLKKGYFVLLVLSLVIGCAMSLTILTWLLGFIFWAFIHPPSHTRWSERTERCSHWEVATHYIHYSIITHLTKSCIHTHLVYRLATLVKAFDQGDPLNILGKLSKFLIFRKFQDSYFFIKNK